MDQHQAENPLSQGNGKPKTDVGPSVDITQLELDADGRLQIRDPDTPSRFRFHFQGLPYHVEVLPGAPQRVRLAANLGVIPYTAESPLGRRYCQRAIHAAGRLPNGRLFLDSDHIRLEAETLAPEAEATAGVFAAIAALLLEFLPYLHFLAEVLPARSRHAGRS